MPELNSISKTISDLYELSEVLDANRLPSTSRMDLNTTLSASSAGLFAVADGVASSIAYSENGVSFSITSDGGHFRLQDTTVLPVFSAIDSADSVWFDFEAKSSVSSSLVVAVETTVPGNTKTITLTTDWQRFKFYLPRVPSATTYANRLAFSILNYATQVFSIRNLNIGMLKNDSALVRLSAPLAARVLQFVGKKVSIIGDSISTAYQANAAEITIQSSDVGTPVSAYATYYDVSTTTTIGGYTIQSSDIGNLVTVTPVAGDVGKQIGKVLSYNSFDKSLTWWGLMANALGMTVLSNVSWSGASLSSHESSDDIYKTSYAWHDAQIKKCRGRDASGNAINPDLIIIYRGTNDFSHAPYAGHSAGFSSASTAIPATDTDGSNYNLRDALALTVKKLRAAYPMAEIVICTLNVFKRITYDVFPTRNGTSTLLQYNDTIRAIADSLGCRVISFDKDGITFDNIYPTYASDSSTTPTHPNTVGHAKMAERAIMDMIG